MNPLLRHHSEHCSRKKWIGNVHCLDGEMSCVEHSLVKNTTVSAVQMHEICDASNAGLTLCLVKRLILDGRPNLIKSIPVEVGAYWNVRDELYNADGLIFFGE